LNIVNYEGYLRKKITSKRLEHSLGVMRTMEEFARVYGLDKNQAILAGLLHDAAKELTSEEWRPIIRNNNLVLRDAEEYDYHHYLHGPIGAILIQRDLSIEDEEVLWAIATHGYYGPWEQFHRPLGWCLRFADILEPGRDWTNNRWIKEIEAPLRDAAYGGRLMEGALIVAKWLMEWYEATGVAIHPNIRRAINQ